MSDVYNYFAENINYDSGYEYGLLESKNLASVSRTQGNNFAKNNIPPYSKIDQVKLYVKDSVIGVKKHPNATGAFTGRLVVDYTNYYDDSISTGSDGNIIGSLLDPISAPDGGLENLAGKSSFSQTMNRFTDFNYTYNAGNAPYTVSVRLVIVDSVTGDFIDGLKWEDRWVQAQARIGQCYIHYNYTPPKLSFSVNNSDWGMIQEGTSKTYSIDNGTKQSITAVPMKGYRFLGWSDNNEKIERNRIFSKEDLTEDIENWENYKKDGIIPIEASFIPIYKISLSEAGDLKEIYYDKIGRWEPKGEHDGTSTPGPFTLPKPYKKGYSFLGWIEPGETEPNEEVIIDPSNTLEHLSFEAVWEKNKYQIETVIKIDGDPIYGKEADDIAQYSLGLKGESLDTKEDTFEYDEEFSILVYLKDPLKYEYEGISIESYTLDNGEEIQLTSPDETASIFKVPNAEKDSVLRYYINYSTKKVKVNVEYYLDFVKSEVPLAYVEIDGERLSSDREFDCKQQILINIIPFQKYKINKWVISFPHSTSGEDNVSSAGVSITDKLWNQDSKVGGDDPATSNVIYIYCSEINYEDSIDIGNETNKSDEEYLKHLTEFSDSIIKKEVTSYIEKTIIHKAIKEYAFYKCNKLQTLLIGTSGDIERFAFGDCSNLQTLIIPKSNDEEITIYKDAFNGCNNITNIIIPEKTSNIPVLEDVDAFFGTIFEIDFNNPEMKIPHVGHIYVPEDRYKDYIQYTNWSIYGPGEDGNPGPDRIRKIEDYPEIYKEDILNGSKGQN